MPRRDSFRIFLSGSTADFGQTRLSLRDALSRGGCHVIHQADFPQTQADTVLKLAQLIEPCGILIHLIGRNPGSVAEKAAVNEYLAIAQKDGAFLKSLPELRAGLGDFSGISLTQWEVLIALHLGVVVFIYGDATHVESTHPQRAHLDRLIKVHRHAETFSGSFDLHNKILADLLYHYRQTLPAEQVPTFTSVRHDLPTIQRFFGRETELSKLLPDIHPDATGWGALIDGPGGMGKTTLAIRAAELAAPGHYDDIVFLSAKQIVMDPHGPYDESGFAVKGFSQILDAIARRLQKPEITQVPTDERPRVLIEALTGTRILLVLDNLETLSEVDQRSLLSFLHHLPRTCKALLTSRLLVATTGRRLPLQKLDQIAALKTLEDIARDNPALAAASETELRHLIIETGSNTLLMTWTAWQVGSGYCTTIADALAHLRSCPEGNDPLEFIFGDLLTRFTRDEQSIVATLSYPPEPIPVSAIVEISGVDESAARRILKLLTNRSIVIPQEGEQEYALVPMEGDFLRRHIPDIVREAGIRLEKFAYNIIVENGGLINKRFDRLEAMWPTIYAAFPLFLAGPNDRLQNVCYLIYKFLNFTGRWDERLSLVERAEARAVDAGDFYSAGWRAYSAGMVYQVRRESEGVLQCAERASSHWEKAKANALARSYGIRLRGKGQELREDYGGAVASFRESLELRCNFAPESEDVSFAYSDLAESERLFGDFASAEHNYYIGLGKAKEHGHEEAVTVITANIAALSLDRKNWSVAEALSRDALRLAEKINRQELIAKTCSLLAKAMLHQGKGGDALPYAQRSVDIFTRLGSPDLAGALAILSECWPSGQ